MSNTLADRIKPLLDDAAANDADVHFLAGAFKAMLKFIYTDELGEMNGDTFFEVFYAAKKYNVTALVKKCTEYPMEKLRSNVFETLLSARFFEEHALRWADGQCRRKGIDCSAENRRQMLGPALFQIRFPLISKEQFAADIGQLLYALRWADGQCRRKGIDCSAENRRQMLGPALFQIRFPLISKEQFAADIVPSGVLTIDEMFRVLLHHCNTAAADSVVPHKHKQYPVHFSAKPRANWPTTTTEGLLIGTTIVGTTATTTIGWQWHFVVNSSPVQQSDGESDSRKIS
ncbi:hypothetical protein niasHS_011840 [Heterodera schachtii]|uniref:BTB domain-containing protein n=1 Tax=Heterodera schachtii TaxID=97005 RepID=A0ABD2IVB1_HETSC